MSADLERRLRERLQGAMLPEAPDRLFASLEAIVQTPPDRRVRRDRRRTLGLLAVAAVLTVGGFALLNAGGTPRETSLDPTPGPTTSPSPVAPSPTTTPSAEPSPSAAPSSSTPRPTSTATASPPPPITSAYTLVRGSARAIGERVIMAPGADGSLFVSVPAPGGAVLGRLGASGRMLAGWPITLDGTTACPVLLVVEDGSIRTVCSAREAPSREAEDARSFAFDGDGRSLAGWPVDLGQTNQLDESALYTGRMIGEELRLSVSTMSAYEFVRVTTITADGEIRRGADVALYRCCSEWAVGPDGIAYGVAPPSYVADGTAEVSQVTAIDLDGRRPGWPLTVDGLASGPVFGSGDRIALTIGSVGVGESHVITFDPRGTAISARSGALPITTAATSTRCQPVLPKPPIVARDGTHYVFGGVDVAIYALDPSLKVRSGWPFEPATPLERTGYDDPLTDYFCPSFGLPAVGPDSTLYLPLQARDGSVGGSIVAVGPDGRVRSGWPVELRKPGAAFWSIVVGADGTAFALAIEPETGGASSATILAIAPNSTVRYTTTVIEPE